MHVLVGHFGRRGFYLLRNSTCVFETQHRFGLFPNSSVILNDIKIEIKIKNFVGDKYRIFKSGEEIGSLDFYNYLYSVISLVRNDGDIDYFKLEESGYSQVFILSREGHPLLKFKSSLNPLRVDKRFEVERLETTYSMKDVEELILYAGEILYRKVSADKSSL